ncbi:hypothetical protein [Streptomonospora salina]|uniref:Uncharacterized protein n=1 Tax=Streptomonospora salina TaxID=104205 RepID=A0A841E7X8_9ACTN|nr:hypothetical protein [Streptomonospora salina]MBB5998584.1 hypothetical protein [Streptomonospora salina]
MRHITRRSIIQLDRTPPLIGTSDVRSRIAARIGAAAPDGQAPNTSAATRGGTVPDVNGDRVPSALAAEKDVAGRHRASA